MSGAIEGFSFSETAGASGLCPPRRAEDWLNKWRSIGGGVTITREGRVNPWRVIQGGKDRATRAESERRQTALLNDLDTIPGLAAGVRAVTAARAGTLFRQALRVMRKESL